MNLSALLFSILVHCIDIPLTWLHLRSAMMKVKKISVRVGDKLYQSKLIVRKYSCGPCRQYNCCSMIEIIFSSRTLSVRFLTPIDTFASLAVV